MRDDGVGGSRVVGMELNGRKTLICNCRGSMPLDVLPPRIFDVPLFRGTIVKAAGHLGAFDIVVDDYAPALPSSRGALTFAPPRDKASLRCDLILDLSGGTPLFPAPEKRDGYLRPDPRDPAALQR